MHTCLPVCKHLIFEVLQHTLLSTTTFADRLNIVLDAESYCIGSPLVLVLHVETQYDYQYNTTQHRTSVPIHYVLDQYNLAIHADSQTFVHLFFGKMLGIRARQCSKAFCLTIAVRTLTLSTYSGTLYLSVSLSLSVSICISIFLSLSLARLLSRSLYYTLLM